MPTAKEIVDNEPWVPLSVGAVFGGTTAAKDVRTAIQECSRCVRRAREGLPPYDEASAAGVNVVFHVAGEVITPEFEGIRTGSWFGKRRTQVVQVAVPTGLLTRREVTDFIATSVEQAVAVAAERMARFRRSAALSTAQAAAAAEIAAAELRALGSR